MKPIRETRLLSLATQYERLLRDADSAKRASLFPLAGWDDYQSLESFKDLYLPAEAEVVPTTLVDNGPTLARELQIKKESLSGQIFLLFKYMLSGYETNIQPDDEEGEPFLESGKWLKESFSEEEQAEIFKTCIATFSCTRCDSIDKFPQILNHHCDSVGGVASLNPSYYLVRLPHLKALAKVVTASPLKDSVEVDDPVINDLRPLRIQHERLEELGNGFSCTMCTPSFDSLARNYLGIVGSTSLYISLSLY